MRLGIMLTSGVESEDVCTVRKLAEAAVAQGHKVRLFLMDDGIFNLKTLLDLSGRGVEIALCTHNVMQRDMPRLEGVLYGGQNDWAEIVNESDRVVVFG